MIVKDSNSTPPNSKSTYAPVSARPGGQPSYNPEVMAPPLAPPPTYDSSFSFAPRSGAEPAGRRFWRAFTVAVLVWLLLSMFVRSIINLALVHRHHKHGGLAKDYPEFESGEVMRCIERLDWPFSDLSSQEPEMPLNSARPPFHSNSSFSLPSNADLLYFLSRGSLASGSVRIERKSPLSVADSVQVDVGVWYWTADALEHASVCALERHDNGEHYGVGIFTPHSWPSRSIRDRLHFEVVVHLPSRRYTALETDYQNFGLTVADMQGSVSFETLRLKTSNGIIYAESLHVQKGLIKSSNGQISGKYNVSESLELVTSNAKIDAEVDMYNEGTRATSLRLRTSNGLIDSTLNLHGQPHLSAFSVEARTSNAPAFLHVPFHTHSSPLTLELRTSNARARAAVHPAFEGPFTLRTSNAAPVLTAGRNEEIEDPSGEGRLRGLDIARLEKGSLDGKVWWGEWTGGEKGWVHVTSSNAPVELDLTGNPI